MPVLAGKKIIIGITGGIAAYKITFLTRLLIKKGAEVQILMTANAKEFVTPLSLSTLSKNEVLIEMFDKNGKWNNHVELGLWADLMIIAPATSNSISKMASAESDNLVLTTYLSAKCPVFLAPAMDLDMYQNLSNQENIAKLKSQGVEIIPAAVGELASGLYGEGRMAEPEEIVVFVENNLKRNLPFIGKKILVTAGPTYEPIDPVRFIGNHSTGKLGFDIAKEACKKGAEVILISGPSHENIDDLPIHLIRVMTAKEMYETVFQYYTSVDVAIMSAAVADYRVVNYSEQKIKKTENELTIQLEKNPDILMEMGQRKEKQFLVGFALETNDEVINAKAKLHKKNLDAIVLNSFKDALFQNGTNKINIIDKNEEIISFETKSKPEIAKDILTFVAQKINAV